MAILHLFPLETVRARDGGPGVRCQLYVAFFQHDSYPRHAGECRRLELQVVACRLVDFDQVQCAAVDDVNFIERPLHDRGQPSCWCHVGHNFYSLRRRSGMLDFGQLYHVCFCGNGFRLFELSDLMQFWNGITL